VIWDCNGSTDQFWRASADPYGCWPLEDEKSGLFIGAPGGSKTPGTALVQWPFVTGHLDQS
jgi:hypothetical protein